MSLEPDNAISTSRSLDNRVRVLSLGRSASVSRLTSQ